MSERGAGAVSQLVGLRLRRDSACGANERSGQTRTGMTAMGRNALRPLLADSVEKLDSRPERSMLPKFDLIERPLLNATRTGDGL